MEEKIIKFNNNGFVRRLTPPGASPMHHRDLHCLTLCNCVSWASCCHAYKYPTAATWQVAQCQWDHSQVNLHRLTKCAPCHSEETSCLRGRQRERTVRQQKQVLSVMELPVWSNEKLSIKQKRYLLQIITTKLCPALLSWFRRRCMWLTFILATSLLLKITVTWPKKGLTVRALTY